MVVALTQHDHLSVPYTSCINQRTNRSKGTIQSSAFVHALKDVNLDKQHITLCVSGTVTEMEGSGLC